MKKGLLFALCAVLMFSVMGCGGSPDVEFTDIDSMPYSIPYYKDVSIELLDVELYQGKIEDHGKYTYSPYVIIYTDDSGVDSLSEDDRYWADQEVSIDYNCYISESKNDLLQEELKYLTSGEYEGRKYLLYSFFDVRDTDTDYYEDFEGSDISLFIYVETTDTENPESVETERYAYFLEDIQGLPNVDDLPQEIQEAGSAAMRAEAESYLKMIS